MLTQDSPEFFKRAVESMPGMVYRFVMTAKGEMYFDYVSPRGLEIYEINQADYDSDASIMLKMVLADDQIGIRNAISQSAATMNKFDWRGRIVTKTGQIKQIHAQSIPQKKSDGSIWWDGVVLETTENMLNEIELEKSNQLVREKELIYRNLLQSAPGAVYQWKETPDGKGSSVFVSSKLFTYFGIPPEESHRIAEMIHPEDRERWRKSIEHANVSGEEWNFQGRLLYPDGSVKWWQGISNQYKVEDGTIFYTGIMIDITKRKLDEISEQENFKKYMAILKALPDSVFILNSSGEYIKVIASEFDSLRGDSPRALGKKVYDLFPPEVAHHFQRTMNDTLRDSLVRQFEYTIEDNKGLHYFEARFVRLDDVHVLVLERDITEKKSLEEKSKFQQGQLVEASKLATVGEMAGGIAHEINNPLAIIAGFCTQILKANKQSRELSKEKLMSNIEKIESTVTRISRIVNGLRNIARDSSGEELQLAGLREVIDEVLVFCGEKFKINEVELKISLQNETQQIAVRPVQFSQVLLNLITNAFHAVESRPIGERWIQVSAQKKSTQNSDIIEFRISDSGAGIPQNVVDKMFRPFFTTKEVGKGTGLGLSISKGIIESHGGRLYLDQAQKNTCFVIELPTLSSETSTSESLS